MAQLDIQNQTTKSSGTGLVTYRALVGAMLAIILSLVATMGSDVRDTLRETTKAVGTMQSSMARLDGRVDDQGERLSHNETSIQRLTEKSGSLDNRVTVLEHKGHQNDQ